MLTSEMAHAKRERENTPAKQHQGKAQETKAQQDLSINMDINSWLLAYKA
jgi:septum formation inhibitor MinC